MESSAVTGADINGVNTISFTVKFAGQTIPITNLSPESTLKNLKALLQPLTNVLPRGMKLISKGKVLKDEMTLMASGIGNGAKIMLMASQGLHQGDGPIMKNAQSRPIIREGKEPSADFVKNRVQIWKATGVIGLLECNLKVIPEEVWDCKMHARVLDLRNNAILKVSPHIACMGSLQKLLLDSNDLSDDSVSWEALKSLKSLTVLSLNQNRFTTLSSELGWIASLKELHFASNQLSSLPSTLRYLSKLEVLKVNNNRISTIPDWIGDIISLIEVDLSSNLLSGLPETVSNLHNLQYLSISNNGLKSLPPSLFKMCLMLTKLDLHNTELTIDILRQIEGWENFDARRRLKQQKKLDFHVVGSTTFDEGADKS